MEAVAERRQQRVRYEAPLGWEGIASTELLPSMSEVELMHAPEQLFVAGDASLLDLETRRVSIIGSRKATPQAIQRAQKISRQLAERGVVVVSGLAKGVDRAAHEAAIAVGGRTLAVVGTPIDRCYPAEHAELQMEIARHHLLVSQFEAGTKTFPSHFVKRNRTMALLSHATVVVEAGDSSGTLSQAAETQRLNHPLFIMKSILSNPDLEWPNRFILTGARVLEVVDQIVKAIAV